MLPANGLINASAAHMDSIQQPQTFDSSQSQFLPQSAAQQMRGLATPVQVSNNTFRPNLNPQAANQPRPTSQLPIQMVSTPPHLRARPQTPPGGSALSNINGTPGL